MEPEDTKADSNKLPNASAQLAEDGLETDLKLTTIDTAMAGETVNAATTTEVEDNNISKQDGSVAQQEQGSQRVLGDDEAALESSNAYYSDAYASEMIDAAAPAPPAPLEADGSQMQQSPSQSGGAPAAADVGTADQPTEATACSDQMQVDEDQAPTAASSCTEDNESPEAAEEGVSDVNTAPQAGATSRTPQKSYFVDGIRAIDVEVDCGPGIPCKLLHVTIDITSLQDSPKPFLGGYRHKKSSIVYHHASSQTPPQPKRSAAHGLAAAAAAGPKLSRQTQTVKAASTSSQTVREAATQMAKPGLELSTAGDRVITPRPYTSAAVVCERRAQAASTIQRCTKGWLARRRAAALRAIKAERDEFLATAAADREAAAVAQRMREVERRTHPLTQEDFELLSSELETWRKQQTAAIKAAAAAASGQKGFDQQAALQLLLAKETRLLQTLDRLRVNAKHENKAKGIGKMLDTLSKPKVWSLTNGKQVMVHTPNTVRAAELQQLYRGLTLANLTLDERLDVLLHVKWAVKDFVCAASKELVELIDREADLLNRGRSPKTLDGLRRRIAGHFLALCKTPAFNPEATKLRLVPGGQNEPEAFEYADDLIDAAT